MAWTKPPQSLVDLFTDSLPDDPRIERRRMFGMPAVFVQGNMCAGVFQDQIFARLAAADREAVEAVHGPHPFEPMPGRGMGGYMRLPDEIVADDAAVARTLAQAVSYVASLPAKVKKPKAAKASKARAKASKAESKAT
jgi:TfoX/Sxy family transcriptional regulator of competence genes